MSNIHESIDNELSTIPYQSMSNRTKRYLKRSMIRLHLYNETQNSNLPYTYNYHKMIYFLTAYFIFSSVYFMASFFSKTV
jgi:hypothetical protein